MRLRIVLRLLTYVRIFDPAKFGPLRYLDKSLRM